MKKNILFVSLLAGLFLTYTACDDNLDEYLSDFSTILYFLNSNEQDITLYKTGEDTKVKATINKAGSDLSTSASAKVNLMDDSQLAIYNAENLTDYKLLPANCYELQANSTFDFNGNKDTYKQFEITFKTSEIDKLENKENYVLGLGLTSTDSVNSKKNIVLYKPKVIVPTVYFSKPGFNYNVLPDDGLGQKKYTVPVEMMLTNKWNFTCDVEILESLVDDYNQENGEEYLVLPAESYSLANEGVISFTSDNSSVTRDLDFTLNYSNLKYGEYILPLFLADCSKEEFIVDPVQNTSLFAISYRPNLQNIPLTIDMLSSNAAEPNEGPLEDLIDGNLDTYFHSRWSGGGLTDRDHHIQVDLKQDLQIFTFYYTVRHNNSNKAPKKIIVDVSKDGVTYTTLTTITKGLPTTTRGEYTSPLIQAEEPFRHLRIIVPQETNDCFAMGEFKLEGKLD